MQINKNIGEWCEEEYVTKLDNIAYQLVLNKYYNQSIDGKYKFISQNEMMYDNFHFKTYINEYKQALILLRQEKINKIKNGNKNFRNRLYQM